MTKCPEMTVC